LEALLRMEEVGWLVSVCVNVVLVALGMAILFGRDWVVKRERQGLPLVPSAVARFVSVVFGILIFVLICFLPIWIFFLWASVSVRH
jgi:hypothetical protein